jgi:uncharacterized membrane protein YraQ (UPF0718 family)
MTALPIAPARPGYSVRHFVLPCVVAVAVAYLVVGSSPAAATFATLFLGLFIEAAPFLLAGAVASALIDAYLTPASIERWLPRSRAGSVAAGALLGMAFPVCECGVVPVVRRLYRKGLPIPTGVAFLLAAPVVNPVVVASTYAAFGLGGMLAARLGMTVLIAAIVGLLFALAGREETLRDDVAKAASPETDHHAHSHSHLDSPDHSGGWAASLLGVAHLAAREFLDMGRYLVAGAAIAAALQTSVPQESLLALGNSTVTSVIALQALAFVLSVCSTVDAFLGLALGRTFSSGAVLGFLVFGPMVDIKSMLMFLGIFRRKAVVYLVVLPFALSLLAGVVANLRLP